MAKKKKKKESLAKRISGEFSRRTTSEAASQQAFVKSELRTRLESLIPAQFRWLFPFIEDFRPSKEEDDEEATLDTSIDVAPFRRASLGEPLYLDYRCQQGNPLNCTLLQQTDRKSPNAKYCQECGFPALLLEKAEIRGIRGRYRVDSLVTSRGLGRLYEGTQLSDSQRVVIKEYLLPDRYFNPEEASARKQAFVRLGGVSLADGRVQDFRLSHPWEAIADANEERCYLVTKGKLDLYPTLREYLARHGSLSGSSVRQILNQVLQTLEFLHGQKYRFPSGQVQSGLAHGNINLDSLLIDEGQFFIYVCDLALWERLFDPSTSGIFNPSSSQDLIALGYVGFYLLAGTTENPIDHQPLNPKDEQQWPLVDFALKAFLLRLMGLGVPFESATAARQALLKLPPETPIVRVVSQVAPDEEETVKPSFRPLFLFLGVLGLVLLGSLIWFLLPKPQETNAASDDLPLRYIKDVSAVPSGKFTYTGEIGGRWTDLEKQKNLVAQDKTFTEELTTRQPKLKLNYQPESSDNQAIQKVISGEKDFAISSLITQLPIELEQKEFAYDGLVVIVAFSYSQRENSLPASLNGQITFEQLRKLYTGEINNWRDLGGPDLPVKLYIPDETEAVRIFEQRVLKNDEKINAFRNLQRKEDQANWVTTSWLRVITRVANSQKMLQSVIQDFEKADANKQIGAIAFSRLSQVFGQCSVYPLALVEGEKDPVQPLIQDNGQPINPTTDLCNDKGSYHPNFQVFKDRSYPLAYPLAVVYPRDNSRPPVGAKFADMLRTQEGQQLLGKTGLVPLYSVTRP